MKALLFLVASTGFTFAQYDTLLDAEKYYPLQTSNYWEYMNYYSYWPYEEDSSFFSVEVVGDTIMPNNKEYKILVYKSIPLNSFISISLDRIDSSTACTYRYSDDIIFPDKEYLFDSLLAEPGDIFAGSFSGRSFGGGSFFQTECLDEYRDTIWNFVTDFKTFQDQSDIPAVTYTLGKGLGFINSYAWELGFFSTTLRYANINGVEFGTRITAIDNKINDWLKQYFLYQNYPNPFNPSTNIAFTILHPGFVTLKVYDILGNEIQTLVNEEKPTGEYKIRFDGSNLAAGIYLYILRAGSFIETRKMVLLR